MIIIQTIFVLFLTFIFVLTINDFYSLVFRPLEVYSKKILILSYSLFFALSVCLNMLGSPPIINMPLTYLAFLGVTFNFKSSLNNKVISSAFIFITLTAFEIVTPHIFGAIFNTSANETLNNPILFIYLFALSRFVPFIIMKLIKHKVGEKTRKFYKGVKIRSAEWIMVVVLPACSLFIMHILFEISKTIEGESNISISLSILAIILSNLIFYTLYFKTIKSVEVEANQALLEKQIDSYASQYDELKLGLSDVDKFKHDTKHRLLNAISELTEENSELQMSMLKKLDDVVEGLYSERYECYTGYSFIDIILNYQKNKADAYGIDLDFNIGKNLDVHIDGKVLSVILGNALDNAVEACVNFKEKEIKFKMMNVNDSLHISVKNNYQGSIEFIDDLPKTIKENPDSHGLGLKSIKKLVEEHQGIMSIKVTNGNFLLQINLLNN